MPSNVGFWTATGGGALDPPGPRWGTRAPAKKDGKHRFAKVVTRPPPAPDPALGDCITTIPLSMQRHVDAAFGIGDNRSRGALDCPGLPGAKRFKQP